MVLSYLIPALLLGTFTGTILLRGLEEKTRSAVSSSAEHAFTMTQENVNRAVELARDADLKALRLDVLAGNTAAERLYESCGFCRRVTLPMYYEDTGWTDFILYELVL